MSLIYHPDVAAKGVVELTNAMRGLKDMEYATALLADPRMTNTKGVLASCGISYRDIKRVRDCAPQKLPTLEAQRRAIDFLNSLDHENQKIIEGMAA